MSMQHWHKQRPYVTRVLHGLGPGPWALQAFNCNSVQGALSHTTNPSGRGQNNSISLINVWNFVNPEIPVPDGIFPGPNRTML